MKPINLRVIGLKTLLIMMTDLLLLMIGQFGGILSALAYDREAWSLTFWIWAIIAIIAGLGSAIIGWWAWVQLRYR